MPSRGLRRRTPLLSELWAFRRTLIMVCTPVFLCFLPFAWPSPEASCAYVMILMAVFWMMEIFPIAITALMPVVLFPLLGVMDGRSVSENYAKDTQMLFIGGLAVAVAVEHVNLHKRIALRLLLLVGSQPKWLMLGFMLVTALLSMWISNTATTAMIAPIVAAVLEQLMRASAAAQQQTTDEEKLVKANVRHKSGGAANSVVCHIALDTQISSDMSTHGLVSRTCSEESKPPSETSSESVARGGSDRGEGAHVEVPPGSTAGIENETLCKGMMLSICYAANIGGSATLTGTGTNVVLAGQMSVLYESPEAQISYTQWMMFALPNAMLCIAVSWIWLQIHFFGFRTLFCCRASYRDTSDDDSARDIIRKEYEQLGSISSSEVVVLLNFTLLVLLWLFRDPDFFPGWGSLCKEGYATDGTAAMLVLILLFVWPSSKPNISCCRTADDVSQRGPRSTVMGWDTINSKMPWNIVLLMGGGFALADGVQKSGLSRLIGEQLRVLDALPAWLLVLVLCLLVASLTETASNAATASIMIPILADLAEALCIHPYYLLYSATIACSFAFMLPVATPPNAIVFGYGVLKIWDMVKAGVVMNVACILILCLSINTYGYFGFGFNTFPAWAVINPSNHTCFNQ